VGIQILVFSWPACVIGKRFNLHASVRLRLLSPTRVAQTSIWELLCGSVCLLAWRGGVSLQRRCEWWRHLRDVVVAVVRVLFADGLLRRTCGVRKRVVNVMRTLTNVFDCQLSVVLQGRRLCPCVCVCVWGGGGREQLKLKHKCAGITQALRRQECLRVRARTHK
jgi:hypothetical protein